MMLEHLNGKYKHQPEQDASHKLCTDLSKIDWAWPISTNPPSSDNGEGKPGIYFGSKNQNKGGW